MASLQQVLLGISSGAVSTSGQVIYDTVGTFSWIPPAGVTSVSVVVIGPQRNGVGGALAYKNNISVTPGVGETVTIQPDDSTSTSFFRNTGTVSAGFGGTRTGDGGGSGGAPAYLAGGGAGGYSGAGGAGGVAPAPGLGASGAAGTGGAAGGGGEQDNTDVGGDYIAGGGGGTGLKGAGANGAGGAAGSGGQGGSGGTSAGINGGVYGGGRGSVNATPGIGGKSGIRIMWPGDVRQFPSTRTVDE